MCTMKVMLSLLLLAVSAIYIVSSDPGKFPSCCKKVSRGKPGPQFQIENFYIQHADPPCVEAVMFTTNTTRIICANPNTPWVKKKQEELRQKKENQTELMG